MDLAIGAITKFFASLRISGSVRNGPVTEVYLGDRTPNISAYIENGPVSPSGYAIFSAQVSLLRADLDLGLELSICTAGAAFRQHLGDLLIAVEGARPQEPLFDKFYRMLADSQDEAADISLLDVGGRARSGVLISEAHKHWNVTVLDIEADKGVDVVADAHTMSNVLGNGRFDGVMSISVFEHLLMPWKAAIEIGKVLKLGGLAAVHTHQTIGMHDMPWDFYRFSDASWPGLFNRATGFEIIETQVSQYMHVIPQLYRPEFADAENAGGWRTSAVLARKICEPRVAWDVELFDALQTAYPLHSESASTHA